MKCIRKEQLHYGRRQCNIAQGEQNQRAELPSFAITLRVSPERLRRLFIALAATLHLLGA